MSLERDRTVCEGYEQSGWRRMYVSTAKFRKLLDVVKAAKDTRPAISAEVARQRGLKTSDLWGALAAALDAYEKEDADG